MTYLMAVQAAAYPLSATSFATESAFAEHLHELRRAGEGAFSRIVLIAPVMSEHDYRARRDHLGIVEAARDGITLIPAYRADGSIVDFWRGIPALWRRLSTLARNAVVMHADLATDVRRPMTAIAIAAAWRVRCPTIFVVDIDFRQHASRFRRLGHWGRGKYLFNRHVQENAKRFQVRRAVRKADLVLLKSRSLVADFAGDQPNVKTFFDTVHGEGDMLTPDEAAARHARLIDANRPLHLGYFGRMVEYKGIDRMVDALAAVVADGGTAHLSLIGDGPALPAVRRQVAVHGLTAHVSFVPQVQYGAPLFAALAPIDVVLATPLIEDTPRAAFDAMARGLPLLAFDISYFVDLAAASGAVALAHWPDARSLADRIVDLDRDRTALVRMSEAGLAFARDNTQRIWLHRRMAWTRELVLRRTAAATA